MKFTPCVDQCTKSGSHCEGCGRSHEEIVSTSRLVASMMQFMVKMNYDDMQEFGRFVGAKAARRADDLKAMRQNKNH